MPIGKIRIALLKMALSGSNTPQRSRVGSVQSDLSLKSVPDE
jgi:hypothetical protein